MRYIKHHFWSRRDNLGFFMLHCKNTTHKRPSLPISRLISHLQDQFYLMVPGKIHSKNVIIGRKKFVALFILFLKKKNLTEELAKLFGCVLIVKCILCYQIVSKLLFSSIPGPDYAMFPSYLFHHLALWGYQASPMLSSFHPWAQFIKQVGMGCLLYFISFQ